MSSSLSHSWLSLASLGRLLPPLGATGFSQFPSSSSRLIISSQFSGLTARTSPGLYCWQLVGSISTLRSLLLYQEKRSPVHLSSPELVVCGLEWSTESPKVLELPHLQLFLWSQILSKICLIYKWKATHHSRKGELPSAKATSPTLNLFSVLYPQTQKNLIKVSLKYGIAVLFQSVLWVDAMLFSSVTTSVPTVANITTSTWRTVNTSFGNTTNHLSAYSYFAELD